MSRILVVDDEQNVCSGFAEILSAEGHEVATARRAEEALARIESESFELVIMDICLPGISGLEAMRQIKRRHPHVPVIVMTGQGTMETAVQATKSGAFDYHVKPFEPDEMLATIAKALESERLMRRHVTLGGPAARGSDDAMIGQSPPMQAVYKAIGRVAPTDATVLIRGESGTGKELVARAIYQHSGRSHAALAVVNCAAIPETLLESELFGYEKGAYTGAVRRRLGKFEQADGGTVFLDEIGDMPLSVQAKILRLLQEREFERLGGNDTVRVDVRLIAATNRDLEGAITAGRFREDLYYRLNVVTMEVPPLRQRGDDIPALVDYFIERAARDLKLPRAPLGDGALDLLLAYSWPGNVRELQHVMQRAMIQTRGHAIQADDLQLSLAPLLPRSAAPVDIDQHLRTIVQRWLGEGGERVWERLLERVERILIEEALQRSGNNQTQAAALLGLPRPTLHARLHKLGLRDRPDA